MARKRPMIGWAHRNEQNRAELHLNDDTHSRNFGDIEQIVTAWSAVNIKISFVDQSASVSCSLSESQQHFVSDLKTEVPPTINHFCKDFRWIINKASHLSLPRLVFLSAISKHSLLLLTSDAVYITQVPLTGLPCFIKSPFGWSHFGDPIKWPNYKSRGFNVVETPYEVFFMTMHRRP